MAKSKLPIPVLRARDCEALIMTYPVYILSDGYEDCPLIVPDGDEGNAPGFIQGAEGKYLWKEFDAYWQMNLGHSPSLGCRVLIGLRY